MEIPNKRVWLLKKGRLAEKCYDLFKLINDRLTNNEDRFKIVFVNVSTGNANGSSAADPDLVDGEIIGWLPVGNWDQLIDNVDLGDDGKVTVTLAANATAQNQFKVSVLKALKS